MDKRMLVVWKVMGSLVSQHNLSHTIGVLCWGQGYMFDWFLGRGVCAGGLEGGC